MMSRPASSFDRRSIPAQAREGYWQAMDGHQIRRIDWSAPADRPVRGSLLFMPGRGDSYEKYLETLDHWARQGWQVSAADWRGQAGSGRLGADPVTGHADDFGLWVSDLRDFWAQWRSHRPGPHVLAGHSMGGHLTLRAVAEGAVQPDALILSAPMLGVLPQSVPSIVLHQAARFMNWLGDSKRPAWKWSEKPGELPTGREALLTHDDDRYRDEQWWRDKRPELVMGPGSWGWVRSALASIRLLERPGILEAIEIPVFLLATRADKLVSFSAIERAGARLPHGETLFFGQEAAHEILREIDPVRNRALEALDDFLDRLPTS
ncbi:alpha/beta hydrolase [Altericroceibacterium spongiae]|uniref:Alpha/beta hydrolase n=1 Tax=Altericroceibacterium spongiae TaxID=2320269 RepID=A0A420EKA2_9SPHN|nr:alpha/beta hydrolase [Altericroceibacterium spongiae]RKF21125.1 alpha/beta hydrolase [Altericroceibacterium spongiae]